MRMSLRRPLKAGVQNFLSIFLSNSDRDTQELIEPPQRVKHGPVSEGGKEAKRKASSSTFELLASRPDLFLPLTTTQQPNKTYSILFEELRIPPISLRYKKLPSLSFEQPSTPPPRSLRAQPSPSSFLPSRHDSIRVHHHSSGDPLCDVVVSREQHPLPMASEPYKAHSFSSKEGSKQALNEERRLGRWFWKLGSRP